MKRKPKRCGWVTVVLEPLKRGWPGSQGADLATPGWLPLLLCGNTVSPPSSTSDLPAEPITPRQQQRSASLAWIAAPAAAAASEGARTGT